MSEFIGGESVRNPKFFEAEVREPFYKKFFEQRLGVIKVLPTIYTKVFEMYRGQGNVDFRAAKTGGYEMVIIKATEGLGVDTMFSTKWQKALEAGMLVGVYHFFRSNIDGKAQADHQLNVIRPLLDALDYKLFSALDIETVDNTTITVRQSRATLLECN